MIWAAVVFKVPTIYVDKTGQTFLYLPSKRKNQAYIILLSIHVHNVHQSGASLFGGKSFFYFRRRKDDVFRLVCRNNEKDI